MHHGLTSFPESDDTDNPGSRFLIEEMTDISVASISHRTFNLGDEIQTLAADQYCHSIEKRFDRDELHIAKPDRPYVFILNGWFSGDPVKCFPPHPLLSPAIIGFHIDKAVEDHFTSEESIDYFREHSPVGCRDQATCDMLMAHGVDAYVSGCLTMTFPKRKKFPDDPLVVMVDMPEHPGFLVPRKLRQNAVFRKHKPGPTDIDKVQQARELLEFYRDRAGLIITTRLHCALPCAAMGIPVILFSDKQFDRMSAAKIAGIRIHRMRTFSKNMRWKGGVVRSRLRRIAIVADVLLVKLWYRLFNPVDWNPPPLDMEPVKRRLIGQLEKQVKLAVQRAGK